MILEKMNQAYHAENLSGSICIAPLRAYNQWFMDKIQASDSSCQKLAYKVGYAVSAIFAYPLLGALALIGVAINLCMIPPENGYSLWARLNGVPKGTEDFLCELRQKLSDACRENPPNGHELTATISTFRAYTYDKNQQLVFDIQGILGEVKSHSVTTKLEVDGEAVPMQAKNDQHQARLKEMKHHFTTIQDTVEKLSQKYGWFPEKQLVKVAGHKLTVFIPLPDHIPLPT